MWSFYTKCAILPLLKCALITSSPSKEMYMEKQTKMKNENISVISVGGFLLIMGTKRKISINML